MRSRLKVDTKCRQDIPDFFLVSNYEESKNWGINKWHDAISYRVFLRNDWNRSTRKQFDCEDVRTIYATYKDAARELLEDPLASRGTFHTAKQQSFVKNLSIADIFEYAEDERLQESSWRIDYLEWASLDPFSRYSDDSHKPLIHRVEKTPSWEIDKDIFGQTGSATVKVDLWGSDSEIIHEFRLWLKSTRKAMKLPSGSYNFNAITFGEWFDQRLLPCFDLLLYGTIYNFKFSISDIADALFPAEVGRLTDVDYVSRVRRTIIPSALQLVSATTSIALHKMIEKNLG